MAQIGDLVAGVQDKLAGRRDVPAKAPLWIQDSIKELSENYPFIELEIVGPDVKLVAKKRDYNTSIFLAEQTHYPTDIRLFELYTDYPANTRTVPIKFAEVPVVMPLTRIPGLPAKFTRYGNLVYFGLCPDKAYTVVCYYQKRHQFVSGGIDKLVTTPIMMPPDWDEIIVLSAAERGAMELRMPDYVTLYHQMLHGDPEKPQELGLLKARTTQKSKDKSHNTGQIMPVVGRY